MPQVPGATQPPTARACREAVGARAHRAVTALVRPRDPRSQERGRRAPQGCRDRAKSLAWRCFCSHRRTTRAPSPRAHGRTGAGSAHAPPAMVGGSHKRSRIATQPGPRVSLQGGRLVRGLIGAPTHDMTIQGRGKADRSQARRAGAQARGPEGARDSVSSRLSPALARREFRARDPAACDLSPFGLSLARDLAPPALQQMHHRALLQPLTSSRRSICRRRSALLRLLERDCRLAPRAPGGDDRAAIHAPAIAPPPADACVRHLPRCHAGPRTRHAELCALPSSQLFHSLPFDS